MLIVRTDEYDLPYRPQAFIYITMILLPKYYCNSITGAIQNFENFSLMHAILTVRPINMDYVDPWSS
jgi:hypothetical protein